MATPAERETTDRSVRDTARQEMPRTLREEVRLAGDALGQVIAEHGGAELLADVETLRRTVIRARAEDGTRGGLAESADKLVSSWSLDRAEQVARAFACYFHLVNLAEERYRARALREADYGASGPAEALTAALATVRAELGDAGLDEQLATLRVHPVFTAHPTEARRRAVTSALQRVGQQLEVLADPRVVAAAQPETRRRLLEEVDALWRTAQLRSQELQPLDEVRTLMGVFDTTLFRLVPAVYRELAAALDDGDNGTRPPAAPAFLRFGSWVGGDRDGNPRITAHVTRETLLIQSEHILRGLEAAATRIGTGLTADSDTTPPDDRFLSRLRAARQIVGDRAFAIEARAPGEPYTASSSCCASSASRRHGAAISPSPTRGRRNCSTTCGPCRPRSSTRVRRARHTARCTSSSGRRRRSAFISRTWRSVNTVACIAMHLPRSQRAARARPRRMRSSRRSGPLRCCSNDLAPASAIATW